MKIDELTGKWNKDLSDLISTEYVSRKAVLELIEQWSKRKETINWGSASDSGIMYEPKTYVLSDILEELKKICQG